MVHKLHRLTSAGFSGGGLAFLHVLHNSSVTFKFVMRYFCARQKRRQQICSNIISPCHEYHILVFVSRNRNRYINQNVWKKMEMNRSINTSDKCLSCVVKKSGVVEFSVSPWGSRKWRGIGGALGVIGCSPAPRSAKKVVLTPGRRQAVAHCRRRPVRLIRSSRKVYLGPRGP